ncbi:MAG: DUF167 domain-containing protein [Firmicutes bacterium]|nr:DUF167 domain-containing protein [Bacillota bacterium]
MLDVREEKEGVSFRVRVQPRSSRNQVAGFVDGALKVRLTAPPVDGEANEACRAFLAGLLGVPRAQVTIAAGHTGRSKIIRVSGVSAEKVKGAFQAAT